MEAKASLWRSVGLVALTIALLGALVVALNPSQPHLSPAPLRTISPGCAKGPWDFTPTNLTEIPGLSLEAVDREATNRALLRLNMDPCSCGCSQSLAACRASTPSCGTSRVEAKRVASEEHVETVEKPEVRR